MCPSGVGHVFEMFDALCASASSASNRDADASSVCGSRSDARIFLAVCTSGPITAVVNDFELFHCALPRVARISETEKEKVGVAPFPTPTHQQAPRPAPPPVRYTAGQPGAGARHRNETRHRAASTDWKSGTPCKSFAASRVAYPGSPGNGGLLAGFTHEVPASDP